MATSGTITTDYQFAEIMSEAFERCQIPPLAIVQEHIDACVRSAQLMLVEFGNRGVHQYQLSHTTIDLEAGEPTYNLPVGTIDLWSAVLTRDGSDTPVWPMGRQAYEYIPKKSQTGRPFNYFVDRATTGLQLRTVTLWPVPDRSTDVLKVWVWKSAQDVGSIGNTLAVAPEWVDAYAAGLAKRMARKFAPGLVGELTSEAEQAFSLAHGTDRERAPLRLRMRGYTRRGRT